MQKEMIIQKLKDRGGRVTRQRLMLLDIILEDECSCCKEIYYRAAHRDEKIGLATVYRMVNTLEEIGAISRKNMYKVVCGEECGTADTYTVEFNDGTAARLSAETWYQIVRTGLKECGYMQNKELRRVRARACECSDCCGAASDRE
ncbi:MAG: Fur family transcriptional regulator [Lachnospiraceae bacterium]|nr:Fur family transcriptional regulator [Lachnospiraceae bacterium]